MRYRDYKSELWYGQVLSFLILWPIFYHVGGIGGMDILAFIIRWKAAFAYGCLEFGQ